VGPKIDPEESKETVAKENQERDLPRRQGEETVTENQGSQNECGWAVNPRFVPWTTIQSNLDITISILHLFTNDTPRDRYIEVLISTKPSQIPRDYKHVICISKHKSV